MLNSARMHPVWAAKQQIIQNNIVITKSLQNRDTLTAAKLRKLNDNIRSEILRLYAVWINY